MSGQQGEESLDDGVVPSKPVAARGLERRHADSKRDLEAGGILARDRVAAGGEPHRLEQRHGRVVFHILRGGFAEAAGCGEANGGVNIPRVLDSGGLE